MEETKGTDEDEEKHEEDTRPDHFVSGVVGVPQLGGDEHLLPREPRGLEHLLQRLPHLTLFPGPHMSISFQIY